MKLNNLNRDVSLKIHYVFDQLLPPLVRDCRWIMSIPLWLLFRHRYKIYLDFKKTAFNMTEAQFREVYRLVSDTAMQRETDLNQASIDSILAHIAGSKVLEVGCGRGFLAKLLSDRYEVTAVDIFIPPHLPAQSPKITYLEENVESLPFADKSFDTVICTHTLEHVRNLHDALSELRRVGKKLIIIVPRQRPYKYTFDLHLNFFPYPYSLLSAMGKQHSEVICQDADGDLFYAEMT